MRKIKLTVLILCEFLFAHFVNAQEYVGLDIRMPKMGKIIVLEADGVNLRKSPSINAPKLMGIEDELGGYDVFWSNQHKGGKSMTFKKDSPLMVLYETEEWYGVPYKNYFNSLVVYVSKKFANEIQLQPVTPEFIQSKGVDVVTKGRYRGYFAINVSDGDTKNCFGRIVNGMAVCNNTVECAIGVGDNNLKRIEFKGFDGTSFPSINFGSDVCRLDDRFDEDFACEDFTKLTDNEVNAIIKQIKPLVIDNDHGYIFANYKNELVQMEYDLSSQMFKNDIVTVPANLPKVAEIPNPNDPKPVAPYKIYKEKPQCNYAWRGLSVQEAYIDQDCTILKMQYDNRFSHDGWININKGAFLKIPGTNTVARLTKIKDISVSPAHTNIGYNEVKTFYLIFEPLPKTTTVFDFYETTSSRWKIMGIRMK